MQIIWLYKLILLLIFSFLHSRKQNKNENSCLKLLYEYCNNNFFYYVVEYEI